MQSDLDSLMLSHGLDALLITGPGQHNPPMVYLTGGAHLTDAVLIKKRGLGVRLEDTFWIEPGAAAKPLADYPLDLVLPLEKAHG